jgi:glycosyltransferase involved in cell wall biosynthesis
MEAMASGCCVVASRVGGNPELIGDSERGLLFEPGNTAGLAVALRTLMNDPELRRSLSSAAQGFIHQRFSVAASITRMEQIYCTVLNLPT